MSTEFDVLKLRRATAAAWAAQNPIPEQGEPCYETDTHVLKIGTGLDHYNDLSGFNSGTVYTSLDDDYEIDPITGQAIPSYTQETIEAALTAIAALGPTTLVTLLIAPGTWPITSNTPSGTLPYAGDYSSFTNVTWKVVPGAILQIATGKTLTIGGPFEAGLYQVFQCDGTGKVLLNQPTNVVWFGADKTGVIDCTSAYQSALVSVSGNIYTGTNPEVVFPSGIFEFQTDGGMTPPASFSSQSYTVTGAGIGKTLIRFNPPDVAGSYLYKNPSDSAKTKNSRFTGMLFLNAITTPANGGCFYFQREQHLGFTDCMWQSFNIDFYLAGTADGDSLRFYNCRWVYTGQAVFYFANSQAVVIELTNCNPEDIYGDVFYVSSAGGGSVHVYGGSWIMDDGGGTTTHYLINLASGSGTTTPDFTFNSIKTEMNSVYTGFVKTANTGQPLIATFNDCNLSTTQGAARDMVDIFSSQMVKFNNCIIPAVLQVKFNSDVNSYAQGIAGGLVEFNGCSMPGDVTITRTGNYGVLRIRGAFYQPALSAPYYKDGFALDTDDGWRTTSQTQHFSNLLKTAKIKGWGYWPTNGDTSGYSVTLPPNSLIKNIYVYKPQAGAIATAFELHVGNGDRSVTYASSGSAAQNLAHTITKNFAVGAEIDVGTDADDRVVRLWCDGGDAGAGFGGGYAIVEYY